MSVPPGRAGSPQVISKPGGWGSWIGTALMAGLGWLSSRSTNAKAAEEAQKNRDFQREMSDTAHSREVADLIRAGINPMLSGRGSGASTPGGSQAPVEDQGAGSLRSIGTALAIRQAKAQIDLTEAQADREGASAGLARTQAADISTTASSGRLEEISLRRDLAKMDVEQKRDFQAQAFRQAEAEIARTLSGARQLDALSALAELRRTGEANLSEFEKDLGEAGPAVKFIIQLMRELKR